MTEISRKETMEKYNSLLKKYQRELLKNKIQEQIILDIQQDLNMCISQKYEGKE